MLSIMPWASLLSIVLNLSFIDEIQWKINERSVIQWNLFDHSPLIKTLEKYVDFKKLQPNGNPNTRLIITAVNVLTAEPD